jgi:hypothetical protein
LPCPKSVKVSLCRVDRQDTFVTTKNKKPKEHPEIPNQSRRFGGRPALFSQKAVP